MRASNVATRVLGFLFVILALLAAWTWTELASFRRSTVLLRNARGMPLRIVVFEPLRGARPIPAIVVCQPVNSPPEAGQALMLEFVRRGMLAVTFDFRGSGPGESRVTLRENVVGVTAMDAAAVLAYLAGRADVDRSRIGLIGHSVGGTLALRAAMEQPWVRATVAVGIAGDVTKALPQDLLWLVGLYDEFRPLSEMQAVMEASNSEGLAEPGRTAGDFGRGSARRLEVSATADHFTEFLNHNVAVRAVEWFESAFSGQPAAPPRLAPAPLFYACYSLAFLFGWLLLLPQFRDWADTRDTSATWLNARRASIAIALLVVLLVIAPLPRLAIFRADLAMWGLALLLAANAGVHARRPARVLVLAWACILITLIVNQVAYFWRYPQFLRGLPVFPFWHFTGLLNSYLFIYPRGLFFSSYTGQLLHPSWLFWSLPVLELARPGLIAGGAWRLVQRVKSRGEHDGSRQNKLKWAAVLLLFAALAALVWLRAAQGFVDRESVRLAGWVILRFAVLPFFLFALLSRRVFGPDVRRLPAQKAAGL